MTTLKTAWQFLLKLGGHLPTTQQRPQRHLTREMEQASIKLLVLSV